MKPYAIVLLLTAGAALAADQELLKLAMPDARIFAGVRVAKIRDTPFGRFALEQFSTAQDQPYDQFVKASGFDPRKNLEEILIARPAAAERRLTLARGAFDVTRILAAAGAAGAGVATYQGVTVLASPDLWLAFLSPSIVALGDPESVRGAIERRQKGAGPPAETGTRIGVVSQAYDAWFVSTIPVTQLLPDLPDENATRALKTGALDSVQRASGGVSFGASVRLYADLGTAGPQEAAKLAAMLKLLAAMLGAADARPEGSSVHLAVTLPEATLESLFRDSGK